jgi:PPK2 family polyphosphate:nucleotide phosphotransferase
MATRPKDFRVNPGTKVNLRKWPTEVKRLFKSKNEYEEMLGRHRERLNELQTLMYAFDRYSMLVIFQAMDAAGKDGAIKHVMSGVNPQGCQVFSFKHPSAEELDHDFLWRTTRSLPERGRIGIFNRSYYEEVLIVRVHPEILKAQKLPPNALESDNIWRDRYRSIVDLEAHLDRNGTKIVKFFLHISKEEQLKRFCDRIDKPDKNWKVSKMDVMEREFWDDYMSAYEQCISETSTQSAPWYIIPADDKRNARLLVSRVIVDTLSALPMTYPELDKERHAELKEIRRLLTQSG